VKYQKNEISKLLNLFISNYTNVKNTLITGSKIDYVNKKITLPQLKEEVKFQPSNNFKMSKSPNSPIIKKEHFTFEEDDEVVKVEKKENKKEEEEEDEEDELPELTKDIMNIKTIDQCLKIKGNEYCSECRRPQPKVN
jgi:hypothetical protein